VNDTEERDRTSQYMPKLSVAPNGRLDVLYYDRRADRRRNVMNEVSMQSSFDAGDSFGPRLRLSSRGFDSRIGFGAKGGPPGSRQQIGPALRRSVGARRLDRYPGGDAGDAEAGHRESARRVHVVR